MCGIAGILDNKHHLENQQILFQEMIQSMKHRGPDDDGIYLEDHVALLHTRLAIIDTKRGRQPMTIGHYTIVYNGECYNADEIKKQLLNENIEFTTSSDTEVILRAYIQYKEKCLSMFKGIFAFAIYDSFSKYLFLTRDQMGVKPLFYTFVNQTFLFASEIKTLLAYPLVQPIIDEDSIHQLIYLGPGKISGSGIFKNIYELKAGEYAIYDFSNLTIHSYFQLKSLPHLTNFHDTCTHLKEMIENIVEAQLKSDVPLGALLSGGLDSSILCAIASNILKKEKKTLRTFSLEFEKDSDYFIPTHFQPSMDIVYIDLMVDTFHTNHTKITLKTSDLIDCLYQAVDARDLPGMADVDTALLCFSKEIKKYVDVVLSGECADEIFGGYPWFKDSSSTYFPWTQNLEFRNSLLLDKYKIDFNQYVSDLYQESIQEAPVSAMQEKSTQQMTYLNLHWFMQTLLDRKDRMCMANSLEARVPYCDVDLMQYVYNIPWSFKEYHDQEKGLLRETMKDLLPEKILHRKKSPFPKTHHPAYLQILRNELSKLNDEPLWKIFNKEEVFKLLHEESSVPWYGQLMTTPQTIAYFLQINYWLKKYKIQIQ